MVSALDALAEQRNGSAPTVAGAALEQYALDLSGDPAGERPAYMTAPIVPPARVTS